MRCEPDSSVCLVVSGVDDQSIDIDSWQGQSAACDLAFGPNRLLLNGYWERGGGL